MARETERSDRRIDRRAVLATAAGMMGLAGCSSGDSEETTEGETEETTTAGAVPPADTTEPPAETLQQTDPGGETTTQSAGCAPSTCSMLPGSFERFDPGAAALPFSFEYPGVMADNIDIADRSEQSTGVLGRFNRCTEDEFDGDIELGISVHYTARSETSREDWYQNNKSGGLEVFATTELSGETVEFLWNPDGNSDSNGAYTTSALIPYDGETGTTYHLTQIGVGIILLVSDVDSVTDACDANVRTTVEMVVESLETNPQTTFEEQFDF